MSLKLKLILPIPVTTTTWTSIPGFLCSRCSVAFIAIHLTYARSLGPSLSLSSSFLYPGCGQVPVCCVLISHFSRVQLFARTVARQAPLSLGFSRQEYWSGLSCPPPGDLPDPESPRSAALAGRSLPQAPPGKPYEVSESPSFDPLLSVSTVTWVTALPFLAQTTPKAFPLDSHSPHSTRRGNPNQITLPPCWKLFIGSP